MLGAQNNTFLLITSKLVRLHHLASSCLSVLSLNTLRPLQKVFTYRESLCPRSAFKYFLRCTKHLISSLAAQVHSSLTFVKKIRTMHVLDLTAVTEQVGVRLKSLHSLPYAHINLLWHFKQDGAAEKMGRVCPMSSKGSLRPPHSRGGLGLGQT